MGFGVFFEQMGVSRRWGTKNKGMLRKVFFIWKHRGYKGLSKRLRTKMRVDKHLSCFLNRKLVEKCNQFKAFIEWAKQKTHRQLTFEQRNSMEHAMKADWSVDRALC